MHKKKILSVLLSLCMIGSLSITSLAATADASGITETTDTTLLIPKGVSIENSGYNKTYSPDITYTYSIAPSTNVGQVRDTNGLEIVVDAGVADALPDVVQVDFDPQLVEGTGTSLSEQITGNIQIDVDVSEFENPGIYRYTITDTTTPATLYNAGIVRSADYDTTRELDVYIVRDPNNGTLGVSGYVLLDEIPPVVVDDTFKTPGYVIGGDTIMTVEPGTDGTPGTEDDVISFETADPNVAVDRYISYNYVITKEITGNMADLNHQFQFNATVNFGDFTVNHTVFAGTSVSDLSANATGSVSANLKNGDSLYIYGVAPQATVTVRETNNSVNPYVVTSSDGSIDGVTVTPGNYADTDALNVSNYTTVNSSTSVSAVATNAPALTITNNLNSPSTTGFLMRVLPFVILLGLCVAGLVVMKKFKLGDKKDDAGQAE